MAAQREDGPGHVAGRAPEGRDYVRAPPVKESRFSEHRLTPASLPRQARRFGASTPQWARS